MITFTQNQQPISRDRALTLYRTAGNAAGYDVREVEAIFARAMQDNDDGEDARDMLADIDGTVEIFTH